MKFKKKFLMILCIILLIPRTGKNDWKKYKKLKIKDIPSIKRNDLPDEFSEKAFEVVDEVIRKTVDINYEILLYFDYITEEIIKCKIGEKKQNKIRL